MNLTHQNLIVVVGVVVEVVEVGRFHLVLMTVVLKNHLLPTPLTPVTPKALTTRWTAGSA
jgi:hypothetical protein